MPDESTLAEPQTLCASETLQERGTAFVFDVLHFREPARAFVLRFDSRVVGYLNRCLHVPTEMDWQPGEFLDAGREFILCSIHGATYQPQLERFQGHLKNPSISEEQQQTVNAALEKLNRLMREHQEELDRLTKRLTELERAEPQNS